MARNRKKIHSLVKQAQSAPDDKLAIGQSKHKKWLLVIEYLVKSSITVPENMRIS
ncbi:hypothetical protein [Clostridium sp.]|uniref:hypothetical protein n=1 Tax=Clostridium sp. TaxID=1506 RepID=UPI003216F2DB